MNDEDGVMMMYMYNGDSGIRTAGYEFSRADQSSSRTKSLHRKEDVWRSSPGSADIKMRMRSWKSRDNEISKLFLKATSPFSRSFRLSL